MDRSDETAVDTEIREALYDLQRYLSDAIPPLMVSESLEVLTRCAPELTASQIHSWVGAQNRGLGVAVPVSDYFFHAIKKIHMLGEYDLLPREPLRRFVLEISRIVLPYCPAEDRELLRSNLQRLGETDAVLSTTPEFLYRQIGASEAPLASRVAAGLEGTESVAGDVTLSSDVARGLRSFALLVDRLQRTVRLSPNPTSGSSESIESMTPAQNELVGQLLALAASSSETPLELNQHLSQLRGLGVNAEGSQMFRQLGRTLPDWALPVGSVENFSEPKPVAAMHKYVSLAGDPAEGAARFREMVLAAVEQFNEGSLARSATMFQLAERIANEKNVDDIVVQTVRQRSHDQLDPEKMRQFAESNEKHALLRGVLNFFTPYTTQGLLAGLQTEEKRDRRRLSLALLEAQGPEARTAALQWLETSFSDPSPDRYFQRNLVYLLRRITPPDQDDRTPEIEAVAKLTAPPMPVFLVKEAIAYLGQARQEAGERALVRLVGMYERMLLRPGDSVYDAEDLRVLLDRTVAAMARFGTTSSVRATVAHGLKRQPLLGDTMARLTDLGSQDLSSDPATVDLLLKNLRSELPMKVLGFVIQRKSDNVFYLLEALSGTQTPEVREALEQIAARFPDHNFGHAAEKTLSALGATPRPAAAATPSLSGDLELFGLPNLLQTLSEAGVNGLLVLKDLNDETTGLIAFDNGKLLDAQVGRIRGNEAVYQLFERPAPGTFSFVTRRDPVPGAETTAREILPIVFEAMRRYDEFRQASVIVPDDVAFELTGIRPQSPPEEHDASMIRAIWDKLRSGATASQCEADVATDAHRVRRLLVHWVEQGAIQQI
ncbi:MAG: DUF4388 domain-containing protein [Acidobacteriota bacterium]